MSMSRTENSQLSAAVASSLFVFSIMYLDFSAKAPALWHQGALWLALLFATAAIPSLLNILWTEKKPGAPRY